ncbi:hypothetical protein [Rhodococcus jostii]|uniref:DUF3558 domain-containing protein n=1 Tax=Rhodococcus jostii TaxID=132919 RepID=A0A1H5IH88_RHOJO|nr:hypothetical protein [Rhodococcus jostii]SEE39613.1 hypothetical protein SAMN04490220_7658 [Rhodococcus jostii]
MSARLRRGLVVPVAVLGFAAAGCGSSIEGEAVAQSGPSDVGSVSSPGSGSVSSPGSTVSTDCAALTKALGRLVSDRPHLTEAVLPGSIDPTCSWSKGPTNVMSTITASVKPQVTDPAVLVEMRNGTNVVPDPRSAQFGGVVLDVVAMALLTPEHSIIVNALDPSVSDATKLDVAFAIAEYLEN